ncbi:MAG: hypothetical protein M3Q07_16835 [Pseudobdellovibrionaceae bacterium]|nr:hypothetical protein [Pseudobdellovibrionaceae bacterium]
MTNKSSFIVPVLAGLIGMAKTALASSTNEIESVVSCDENTREFVLTSDNPLYSCPANPELSTELLVQCNFKAILSCMIEEGIVVDAGTLAQFGDTVPERTVEVPTTVPTVCL